MLKKRGLKIPAGYNPTTQRQVGLFAAQFDDPLRLLLEQVKPLTTKQLEWQPKPGVNTIGMLLAHLAVVEIWWVLVAPKELPPAPDGDIICKKVIGIIMDDDGLPLKSDAKHPRTLAKLTAEDYIRMLRKARRAVHKELRTWNDASLEQTFRRRIYDTSRTWVLYHVLEHFAGHFGQILLLKHLMRDAGVLKGPRPR